MSREAFEAWARGQGARDTHFEINPNGHYAAVLLDATWHAWSARDAEVAALKARVEKLEAALRAVKDAHGQNILTPNCLTNPDIYEIIWEALQDE